MKSFLSGELGTALISYDGAWHHADVHGQLRRSHACETAAVLQAQDGFAYVQHESIDAVKADLRSRTMAENAVFLCLSVYDPDLSFTTRVSCADAANDLLADEYILRCVSTKLFSRALPTDARADFVTSRTIVRDFSEIRTLTHLLFSSQPAIDEILAALALATADLEADERAEIKADLSAYGMLANLALSFDGRSREAFNKAAVDGLLQLKQHFLNARTIDTFTRMRSTLQVKFFGAKTSERVLSWKVGNSAVLKASSRSQRTFEDLLNKEAGEFVPRLRKFEIHDRVSKQIDAIKNELLRGRLDLSRRYADELVKFQLSHSETHHLAMSLCNLSGIALYANQLDVADDLSAKALLLGLDDPVIYTTRAEVLKNLGLFDASLNTYTEAKARFPESSYAWAGVADVLKERGSYTASLAAYQDAQAHLPEIPVVFNGEVSTLRYMGNVREAQRLAFKTSKRFPEDSYSRGTLASILVAEGQFDRAIEQYQIAMRLDGADHGLFRGYIRALNGAGKQAEALDTLKRAASKLSQTPVLSVRHMLADQYRRTGDLESALAVGRKLFEDAPGYTPASFDIAASLMLMGDVAGARQHIPQIRLRSEIDWYSYRLYLLTVLQMKDYETARQEIANALEKCVWTRPKVGFKSLLAWAQYETGRADEGIRTLNKDLAKQEAQERQKRLILLGVMHRNVGDKNQGNLVLRNIAQTKDEVLLKLRDSALRRDMPTPLADVLPALLAVA